MITAAKLRCLVLAVVLVVVTGLALHDHYPWSGPVVMTVTATHGVHATDPLLLAVLVLGLALLGRSAGLSAARLSAAGLGAARLSAARPALR